MKNIFMALIFISAFSINAQTLFYESFDEVDGSVTGADSTGISWTTITPHSGGATDYFQVITNTLEARDANGPAFFETDDFSVSLCTDEILISMDLSHVGDMEGNDPSEYGCNIVDVIKLEWSWDSGSTWNSIGDPIHGLMTPDIVAQGCGCGNPPSVVYPVPWACSDAVVGPFIAIGDFDPHTSEVCIPVEGTNMRIKITTMQWAGAEYHNIDNIRIQCSNCLVPLPVELLYFEGRKINSGNQIRWATASENESDYFSIERSEDGYLWDIIHNRKAAGYTNVNQYYEYIDDKYSVGTNYYRLKQYDFNGQSKTYKVIAITNEGDDRVIIKRYNVMGIEVDAFYRGIVIRLYNDGSTDKIMNYRE